LLTEDPEIDAALTKVRTIAHNWNEPMTAAQDESRDWDGLIQLGNDLTTALDGLERATRRLTAIQFIPPASLAGTRRWYLLWLR